MSKVIFSHGKESGPQATKIVALQSIAENAGLATLSVDYRGIDSPEERVEMLVNAVGRDVGHCILVGSSMGAYVSLKASPSVNPTGLFLLAPAVYMPGYEAINAPPPKTLTAIYHGWQDSIVPVDNAIKYARNHQLELTLLKDDHRLSQSILFLQSAFATFLERLNFSQ